PTRSISSPPARITLRPQTHRMAATAGRMCGDALEEYPMMNRAGKKSVSAALCAASVAALAAMAAPAHAQQAAEQEQAQEQAGAGNTIIVTAQFREQNLQDTPLSITAVTGELLDAR